MGRHLRCTRLIPFFGKEFESGEQYDIDAFAEDLGKDADWLYAKMLRPLIQVRRDMVPCFVVVEGGDEDEDEAITDAEPSLPPEPDTEVDRVELEIDDEAPQISYPQESGGGWWLLSDGSKSRDEKIAKRVQRALNEKNDSTE